VRVYERVDFRFDWFDQPFMVHTSDVYPRVSGDPHHFIIYFDEVFAYFAGFGWWSSKGLRRCLSIIQK
jgi:hypothetical protein